jgi:hypothetical protein
LRTYNDLNDPAHGDDILLSVTLERGDVDVLAGLWRLNDHPLAKVHPDMPGVPGRAVGSRGKQQVPGMRSLNE